MLDNITSESFRLKYKEVNGKGWVHFLGFVLISWFSKKDQEPFGLASIF